MIETQNIEFKQRWRDDFLAELCGFANAQGGVLYIGVDDKGNPIGVADAERLLEKLPNLINQTMRVARWIQRGKGSKGTHVETTQQVYRQCVL